MASRLAGPGTGATASVRRHAGGGARAPRALRMLQRGPADPLRRSERNGVSIELPNPDVGLLSASRDIEIAVSGNAEHPRIKIQRFAVPQSAGRTAVKECCACERSRCRGRNCNVTGYQTVKWHTSSTAIFFGKVRCATVRNAYNFSHTDPLRPVCCTEKKIPAAVERSCWFARGTCRALALV